MPIVMPTIIAALVAVTQYLPIGTNLALLHLLWMLVSGSLLDSRGALFPGLLSIGLKTSAIRRAWAAFRYGSWNISELLAAWQEYVISQSEWVVHEYEGYRPKAIDLTAFWRPQLKNCPSKHYHPQAGKALPSIVLGIVGLVGHLGSQRVLLPSCFVRVDLDDPSQSKLQENLLKQVVHTLEPDEVAVLDAGFKVKELQSAGITRFVVRLAKNFTARRNIPAFYQGRGRPPEYGQKVRPLVRCYRGTTIHATPPDRTVSWQAEGVTLQAELWENLVLSDVKPQPDNQTFSVMAINDPRYVAPVLLAFSLTLTPASVRGLYRDRWPVEQPPLAAKQMLGAHRQFVSAPESCQRLPELALLAGSILTFLAASLPAMPTGFWDRHPRPTPGRLRRALSGQPFPETYPLPGQFRRKASFTAHLPKGVCGHRRSKLVA